MSQAANKLTILKVKNLSDSKLLSDGNGLYPQVRPDSKTWVYRYIIYNHPRMMGLGSNTLVLLAEARDEALSARNPVRSGIEPITQRKSEPATPVDKAMINTQLVFL